MRDRSISPDDLLELPSVFFESIARLIEPEVVTYSEDEREPR